MSQKNVERVIGVLATDESLRRQFTDDPRAVLHTLIERGMELTACECQALAAIDPEELVRFARCVDPRLQRTEVTGGGSCCG